MSSHLAFDTFVMIGTTAFWCETDSVGTHRWPGWVAWILLPSVNEGSASAQPQALDIASHDYCRSDRWPLNGIRSPEEVLSLNHDGTGLADSGDARLQEQSIGRRQMFSMHHVKRLLSVRSCEVESLWNNSVLCCQQ